MLTRPAEKAFAKLNGSYESIVAGQENEALADITGGLPQDYKLRGHDATEGLDVTILWNNLTAHKDADEINLVCSSAFNAGSGIMSGHAYGVVDLKTIQFDGAPMNMVKIRNPWGKGEEWNGRFNDDDKETWLKLSDDVKTDMGFSNEDDGSWWMTMNDFYKHFDVVNVCRLLRQPHWTGHYANGEWFGSNVPGGQTSYLNPQYQLMIHEDSTVFVNIGRPSSRPRNAMYEFGTGPLVEFCSDNVNEDGSSAPPARVGKRIFDVGLTKNRKAAKLEVDRECCVQLQMKASDRPYLIVPITQHVGNQGQFFLSVFTSGKSEFIAIEDEKSGYSCESHVTESIVAEKSGGCFPNCETWWKNPQYLMNVQEAGQILIVLDNEGVRNNGEKLVPLGFAVFKAENDHLLTFSAPGQHLKTSAIAPRSSISEFLTLEVGKYMILPFTFEKEVPLHFRISAYADITFDPIVPVTLWASHYIFSNEWTEELSGGWCVPSCSFFFLLFCMFCMFCLFCLFGLFCLFCLFCGNEHNFIHFTDFFFFPLFFSLHVCLF